jgi:hypothetical protein
MNASKTVFISPQYCSKYQPGACHKRPAGMKLCALFVNKHSLALYRRKKNEDKGLSSENV